MADWLVVGRILLTGRPGQIFLLLIEQQRSGFKEEGKEGEDAEM